MVDNIQENALEEPVRRNLLSAAVSYTTKNMVKYQPYEKGAEAEFGAEIALPISESFSLQQELGFYSKWLSSYEDGGFERSKNELSYST